MAMLAFSEYHQSSTRDSTSKITMASDVFLWIITACVPTMDDAGNYVCISGNTTDISLRYVDPTTYIPLLIIK